MGRIDPLDASTMIEVQQDILRFSRAHEPIQDKVKRNILEHIEEAKNISSQIQILTNTVRVESQYGVSHSLSISG